MVGEVISVKGKISNSSYYNGNSFFQLKKKNQSLKVVEFESDRKYKNGEEAEVEGEVAIYLGEIEVIADSVEND